MRMRAGIWAIGLIGSLAAHAGLLALIPFAIRPDPITEQPLPPSELEVQAYQLDRTEAREQQPESQQAKTETPDGASLGAGAIPASRARESQADPEIVRPEAASAPSAVVIRPPGQTVAQAKTVSTNVPKVSAIPEIVPAQRQTMPVIEASVVAPAAVPIAALPTLEPIVAVFRPPSMLNVTTPALVAVAPVSATKTALPVALPVVETVQGAAPQAAILPQAQNAPDRMQESSPQPIATPSQRVVAPQVQPATPSAQKLKAALAFSGADGDVDPVSIAAFQSFMQPGDVAASGDQLRDGVAGLLAQVPCSRMQVAFDPDTATLQVNGHIPDDDLRAPVLQALRAQMGANITVSDNILILPRPQCGALTGIAAVGLPQSTDQITNPLVIGEDAQARVFNFGKGDLLSLDMTAPDYDAYIYLDYFDAEGTVLHLEPNEYAPLRQADAQAVQQIGARTMEDSGLKLVIGPPYGQEIAVAFAASEPLYAGVRPIQEPADEYLEWLKMKVAAARKGNPDFKGEWVYFFVSTKDR